MVLVLGAVLIFAALFIVFAAIGGLSAERQGVSRSLEVLEAMTSSPEELTKESDKSFSERVMDPLLARTQRSEDHTSELQSLMRTSYAVFRLKNNIEH